MGREAESNRRTGGVHREWEKRGKMGLWRGSTTGWDEAGELELNYGKESESEDRLTDSKENVSGVLMPETHKWDEEGCGRRSLSSLGTGAERRLSATKLEIRLGNWRVAMRLKITYLFPWLVWTVSVRERTSFSLPLNCFIKPLSLCSALFCSILWIIGRVVYFPILERLLQLPP